MNKLCFCLIILLSFITTASFAQKPDTLRRNDGNGVYFVQVSSFGLLTDEGYLHNGIKNGIWTTYWHTKFPKDIFTYKEGKKEGMHIGMTVIGNIELIENYKNDKIEGPRRVYSGEGLLLEEALYSGGQKHGPYTKWYPNNKKMEEGSYVYDKRDGKTTWYYEKGGKAAEYYYRDDAIDGDAVTYFKNGMVSANGPYVKDKQQGNWKEYYENGNMKAEGKYENGEKEGVWKEYDEEGKNPKSVTYKKGQPK